MRLAVALLPFAVAACSKDRASSAPPPDDVAPAVQLLPQPHAYRSCDAQMSIVFPAGSTNAVLEEPMVEKVGAITLTDYMVSSQGEHIAYTVSWTDYPHQLIERTGAPRLLRDIENGTLEAPDLLESDQELLVQGMPARMNTHGFKSHPGRVKALWIVRGDRVYAVQVTTSVPGVIEAPSTREFFESFRFMSCGADSGAGADR